MLAAGIRQWIQGTFTRHKASKKWEGWEQEEPTMESVQEHWLKENLNKVMTLKPKAERVS